MARKVGEVPENEEKFHSWSGVHGYYTRPETVSNPFKTDKMLNSTFDKSKMIENLTLCATQREINKSQVEFKPRTAYEPKMLGRSTSSANFVDQRTLSSIMHEKGKEEYFQESFERVSGSSLENGEDISVSIKSIPAVVNDCMGTDAPEFIVDKFVEVCNKNSAGGRITWSKFK